MSCFSKKGHTHWYLSHFWGNFLKKTFSFPCIKKQLAVRVTTCCCLYIWEWRTLILLLNLLALGFLVLRNTRDPAPPNLIEAFCKQEIWHIHAPSYCLWENEKKIYKYSRFLPSLVFYWQYLAKISEVIDNFRW